MAAIAATNVTYTPVKPRKHSDEGENLTRVDVAFGNGVLTYPANGIPLLSGPLGCKNTVTSLHLMSPSAGDGYVYKYDSTNFSIRIYQSSNTVDGTPSVLVELTGAAAPPATTIRVEARGW